MRAARELALAFTLLTRLPAWRLVGTPAPALRDAVWAFPLAGLVVGGVSVLVRALVSRAGAPPALAAVWSLAAMVLLTGGLHEDAVADTADAMGGATVERRLAIMRDSRIGSFGATALVLTLLLRAAALMVLSSGSVVASVVCARAAMGAVLALLPPARADGLGAMAGRATLGRAGLGVLIAALVCFMLLAPARACVCLGAAAVAAGAIGWLGWRCLGGQTGDLCGAAGLAAEVLAMSALVDAAN